MAARNVKPIKWHEEFARNEFLSLVNRLQYLRKEIDQALQSVKDFDDYVGQIERAKSMKKKSFDRNRFKAG
jgi:hypothetical protein